jgi:hypothetical protein
MKIIVASIGVGVGLLAALPAHAGPCSTEIETLTQALASAGTGPAAPATVPGIPKAPSTSGTLPADPLQPQQAPKLPDSHTMPKAPSTSGTLPPNPLEPTANAAGSKVTDSGAMPQAGAAPGGEAAAALQRARDLDLAGDEAGCMDEIAKAKDLIVTQ